ADKSNHYSIGELATSSLLGLVATIKEHITKPTAMAQGRVAHLIEWKGWGGGGEAGAGVGGWSGGWARGGGSWGPEEDQQFYSQMTDEIKEARFAAGVAEQFALAEAAMSFWSLNDCFEQPSTSLQGRLSLACAAGISSFCDDDLIPLNSPQRITTEAAVRHIDSSSLSEDDVFYN
uniref:Family with sequence similarity 131 member C n=1 Tax=Hippocampus comes TaxID=109280 RepID=A0A3Q2XC12_HIPCM